MRWREIEAQLDAGQFEVAIEVALDEWRANRHPVLADLVDAIAAHITPTPLAAHGYHAAWLELAGRARARDLGALIGGLRRSLPRPVRVHEKFDAVIPRGWIARVAALAELPDDPRLAAPLVRVMRDVPWSVYRDEHAPTYGAPLDLIARIGDVRVVPALEELLAAARERRVRAMWYLFAEQVPEVIATLQARAIGELAAADVERARVLISRYARAASLPKPELGQLLALVHDDPDDDAARDVYADALLEAGDARGELMALQLGAERGDITPDGVRRARSLLRANHEAWLGDLAFVTKSLVFERGMLAEADLVQNAAADRAVWERAPRDARLATVHTLHKGRGNEAHYQSFVFSPAMRGLREVTMLSNRMIERMCGAREPWRFTHVVFDKPLTGKTMAALAATAALPHLERITLAIDPARIAETVRMLAPFARARGLVEIAAVATGWYPQEPALATWFGSTAQLEPTAVGFHDYYFHLRARAGSSGLVVDLEVVGPHGIGRALSALPTIERLVVRPRDRRGTRLMLVGDELTAHPQFGAMLEQLAPYHPELPPEWTIG